MTSLDYLLWKLRLGGFARLRKQAYRKARSKVPTDGWIVLRELIDKQQAVDINGQVRETEQFVTDEEGAEIYRTVKEIQPGLAVEIGFLHGYSTLHILQAMADLGRGRLISIDPGQFGEYVWGMGLMNVRRANLDPFHLFWPGLSQVALPELLHHKAYLDFAFVDGSHLLDYTLLEFFYLDKMLRHGGRIVFHDYHNPSVFAALSFIEANFPYSVLPSAAGNLRILVKNGNDERPWYYFVPFYVPQIAWTSLEGRQPVDQKYLQSLRDSNPQHPP